MFSRVKLAVAAVAVSGCMACSPVAPWQRGILARPQMAMEPNPIDQIMRGHVYSSREAAPAIGTAAGGGCGCY